jgi:hypothetical protein
MEEKDIRDGFIRKIVTAHGAETAPEGFTGRIMERIGKESPATDTPLLSPTTWIALILAAAALITVVLTIDIPFFNDLLSPERIRSFPASLVNGGVMASFVDYFRGLNLSGTTAGIILAAIGLVVLERILHRKFYSIKLFTMIP